MRQSFACARTITVADPNVAIQESKALTCDIEAGRRAGALSPRRGRGGEG